MSFSAAKRNNQQKKKLRLNQRSCLVLGISFWFIYVIIVYHSLQRGGGKPRFSSLHNDDDGALPPRKTRPFDNSQRRRRRRRQNTQQQMKNKRTNNNNLVPIKVLYDDPPEELKLSKPIINVGFPKAGTSSIFNFFHCNGLKAQHWLCCEEQVHPTYTKQNKLMSRCIIENIILNRSNIFQYCGDYDVYTEINGPRNFQDYHQRTLLEDGTLLSLFESISIKLRIFFPQHHHLYKIHTSFPNATFILNTRPVGSCELFALVLISPTPTVIALVCSLSFLLDFLSISSRRDR